MKIVVMFVVPLTALGISIWAIHLSNETMEFARTQYEELTKPHAQHQEIYDKLVRLDNRIELARQWTYWWSGISESSHDYEENLREAEILADNADKAWRNSNYGDANTFIDKAYDCLAKIPRTPLPSPTPIPTPTPTPAPEPPPAGANWGLIIGIIGAVVVTGLLVYFLWWRR